MKPNKALFILLIATFSIAAFGQVKVSSALVKYERKGADISEYKKTFHINYPKFSGLQNPDTLNRLEKTFSYWEVFDTNLEEQTDNQWLESLDYLVRYNKNDVLVIEFWMAGSGAYPDQTSRTIIADTNSGLPIKFTETFQNRIGLFTAIDKAQDLEIKAAVKRMKEDKTEDSDGLFDTVRKASDHIEEFTVSDTGVTFIFDYGFPHAIQALQPEGRFFFSWNEIQPYLREYSTIDMIRQKVMAAGTTTVVMDLRMGGILGGVKNGNYFDVSLAGQELKGTQPVAVVTPGQNTLGLTIDKFALKYTVKIDPQQSDEVCPDFRLTIVSPEAKKGIAFTKDAKWNPVPRSVAKLDNNSAAYLQAVGEVLKANGLPNSKPKIEEIYKTDLDGDGTDEVIILATNYTRKEYTVETGGYSFAMVRQIVNGKVANIVLGGDFITDEAVAENTYELSGIVDLDGDGKMEIVMFSAYYEGAATQAFKIENGVAKVVLETECGL